MPRRHFVSALVGCLLFAGSAVAGPETVHEGEWEVTSNTVIQGMPAQPPPITQTHCITKKDVVPKPPRNNGNCTINHKLTGARVTFTVSCQNGPSSAEGKGEITYTGDTMTGTMVMKVAHPQAPNGIEARQTLTGRRIGDCKAAR